MNPIAEPIKHEIHEHELTMIIPPKAFHFILEHFKDWKSYLVVQGKIQTNYVTQVIHRYLMPMHDPNPTQCSMLVYKKKRLNEIKFIPGIIVYKHQTESPYNLRRTDDKPLFGTLLTRHELTMDGHKLELSIRTVLDYSSFVKLGKNPRELLEYFYKNYAQLMSNDDNIKYDLAIESPDFAENEGRRQGVQILLKILHDAHHTLDFPFYTNILWWAIANTKVRDAHPLAALMRIKVLQLEIPKWNEYVQEQNNYKFWMSYKADGISVVGALVKIDQTYIVVLLSRLFMHLIFQGPGNNWIKGLDTIYMSGFLEQVLNSNNIIKVFDGECIDNFITINNDGSNSTYICFSAHEVKDGIIQINDFMSTHVFVQNLCDDFNTKWFIEATIDWVPKTWAQLPVHIEALPVPNWKADGYIIVVDNGDPYYKLAHFKIKMPQNCTVDVLLTSNNQARILINKKLEPIPQLLVCGTTLNKNFVMGTPAQPGQTNQIVECQFDGEDHRLLVIKERPDKIYPNTLRAFFSTLMAYRIPELEKMVLTIQPIGDFQHKVSNNELRFLFTQATHNAIHEHLQEPMSILDLGCGRFSYYKIILKAKPITYLGVDSSIAHLSTAIMRLCDMVEGRNSIKRPGGLPVRSDDLRPIHFLQGSFTNTALIYDVGTIKGRNGFENILCIHALHFAAGNDEDLQTFADICNSGLSPSGQIIIICMDGDKILRSMLGFKSGDILSIANGYLKWRRVSLAQNTAANSANADDFTVESCPPFTDDFRLEPLVQERNLVRVMEGVNLKLYLKTRLRANIAKQKSLAIHNMMDEMLEYHVCYIFKRRDAVYNTELIGPANPINNAATSASTFTAGGYLKLSQIKL